MNERFHRVRAVRIRDYPDAVTMRCIANSSRRVSDKPFTMKCAKNPGVLSYLLAAAGLIKLNLFGSRTCQDFFNSRFAKCYIRWDINRRCRAIKVSVSHLHNGYS